MTTAIRHYDICINGAWRTSSQRMERSNPRTGERVCTYVQATDNDTADAIDAASVAFDGAWRTFTAHQRAELIIEAARIIAVREEEFAHVESYETGKPLADALSDIRAGVELWKFAAASLRSQHGSMFPMLDDKTVGMTLIEPVGVVGLITPWNFPFIVASERLPFILAAGCSVVMKPSEFASGTALLTATALNDAGIPPGVFNVITGFPEETAIPIVEHPDVAMISFTGSTENGRKVMATASKTLKRVSLELGGKSPIIVFSDAQLDHAADAVILGFTHNSGQCCIATTRLLVERSIAKPFEGLLVEKLRTRFASGALQPTANEMQYKKVRTAIDEGLKSGRCVFGGSMEDDAMSGLNIIPAVFAELPDDSDVLRKEIFGPVLTVQLFDTEEEAVSLANDTQYGLAAGIWTEDQRRAFRCAKGIRAGRIWINSEQVNYPELPVGGYKSSGIGREAGVMGIATYSEIKTIIMR